VTHPQHPYDCKQEIQHELERQELLKECHSLVSAIGQHHYSIKLLRSARQGLLMHLDYKSKRQQRGGETR